VRLEALSHWAARGTDMILTDVVKSSMEPVHPAHQKTNQPYASVMFVHAGPPLPPLRWDSVGSRA
jgi:hypothetical protein